MKQPVVPPATAAWFSAGETCDVALPGDLVIVYRSRSFLSRCIRFGQWLRGPKEYSWASHCAIVVSQSWGDKAPVVIEELARGCVETSLADWAGCLYCVVHPISRVHERNEAVSFARWCLGEKYGYATIVGQIIDMTTSLHLSFGTTGRMVCSGLACRAHERLGLVPDKDPSMITPADMARYYGITLDPALALYGTIT